MSFPNFPDELSEFLWPLLIFQPKISEDLFILGFTPSLPNFPDNFPNVLTTFLILAYFLISGLLSELWPKMEQEPVPRFPLFSNSGCMPWSLSLSRITSLPLLFRTEPKSSMRIAKMARISPCFGKISVGWEFPGIFFHNWSILKQNSFMIILKFSFSTIHSPPDYFHITEHIFNEGDSAQVCQSQGKDFSCPTAEALINATCDRTRCPLQGPPMAPVMESQLSTGWSGFGCKEPTINSEKDYIQYMQCNNCTAHFTAQYT